MATSFTSAVAGWPPPDQINVGTATFCCHTDDGIRRVCITRLRREGQLTTIVARSRGRRPRDRLRRHREAHEFREASAARYGAGRCVRKSPHDAGHPVTSGSDSLHIGRTCAVARELWPKGPDEVRIGFDPPTRFQRADGVPPVGADGGRSAAALRGQAHLPRRTTSRSRRGSKIKHHHVRHRTFLSAYVHSRGHGFRRSASRRRGGR